MNKEPSISSDKWAKSRHFTLEEIFEWYLRFDWGAYSYVGIENELDNPTGARDEESSDSGEQIEYLRDWANIVILLEIVCGSVH